MTRERKHNWVSPSWWQDYNKWHEISLLYKVNKHKFSVIVFTVIWWLSIAIWLISSQCLKLFLCDFWGFHFSGCVCAVKVSHITHSRGKVFPLLCFVYYIMSVNFKAVSQASVYVDFHVTLKPRRPTFNYQHKIKHQLQHPRRPGLSAQLSSLLAHGVGEKGLMIAWWSLSCKCAH